MSAASDYMKEMMENYINKQLLEFPFRVNKNLNDKNNKILNKGMILIKLQKE